MPTQVEDMFPKRKLGGKPVIRDQYKYGQKGVIPEGGYGEYGNIPPADEMYDDDDMPVSKKRWRI
jgi:hypothetical protein